MKCYRIKLRLDKQNTFDITFFGNHSIDQKRFDNMRIIKSNFGSDEWKWILSSKAFCYIVVEKKFTIQEASIGKLSKYLYD